MIRRQDEQPLGRTIHPASFTLHEGDHGAGGVIAIRTFRTFSVDTALTFTVVERPAIGRCRVFDRAGDNAELVHLAASRQAAEDWLSPHGYPKAVLQDVTADEIAADAVEGRITA